MSGPTTLLPFQPATMTGAQLAVVSFLARYSGRTHSLYAYQLREWFAWCESNGVDPLVGVQRAHVELYIRGLGDRGLMDSSVNTMMHAVRGYFRFAHIDGLIGSDPAVYARLPKIHRDESPHPGHGPARADQVPPDRPDPDRPPRRPRVSAGHQRPARLRSSRSTNRGLRRHPARIPGATSGRQGQQASHHAADRPGAPGPGGLPGPAHHWAADTATGHRQPDRPPLRLPHGRPDRQSRRHPTAHQPTLTTARRDYHPYRCRPRDGEIGDPAPCASRLSDAPKARVAGPRPGTFFFTAVFWPYMPSLPHKPKPVVAR